MGKKQKNKTQDQINKNDYTQQPINFIAKNIYPKGKMQDIWKIVTYKDFKYCFTCWRTKIKQAKKKKDNVQQQKWKKEIIFTR